MATSSRDLAFRIALVTLCAAALVEIGVIVCVDHQIAWSRGGAVLGAGGLFCAWLVFSAVRRFETSRIERVFLSSAQVLLASGLFVNGLGRVPAGHQVDGGFQMLCGVILFVTGVRAVIQAVRKSPSMPGLGDDV